MAARSGGSVLQATERQQKHWCNKIIIISSSAAVVTPVTPFHFYFFFLFLCLSQEINDLTFFFFFRGEVNHAIVSTSDSIFFYCPFI